MEQTRKSQHSKVTVGKVSSNNQKKAIVGTSSSNNNFNRKQRKTLATTLQQPKKAQTSKVALGKVNPNNQKKAVVGTSSTNNNLNQKQRKTLATALQQPKKAQTAAIPLGKLDLSVQKKTIANDSRTSKTFYQKQINANTAKFEHPQKIQNLKIIIRKNDYTKYNTSRNSNYFQSKTLKTLVDIDLKSIKFNDKKIIKTSISPDAKNNLTDYITYIDKGLEIIHNYSRSESLKVISGTLAGRAGNLGNVIEGLQITSNIMNKEYLEAAKNTRDVLTNAQASIVLGSLGVNTGYMLQFQFLLLLLLVLCMETKFIPMIQMTICDNIYMKKQDYLLM